MRSNSRSLDKMPQPSFLVPPTPALILPQKGAVPMHLAQEGIPQSVSLPPSSPQQAPLLPGIIRPSSRRIRSGTSTGSLMTWWLRSSSLQAALCGPARTMMETCSRTSWPRVRREPPAPVGLGPSASLAEVIFRPFW